MIVRQLFDAPSCTYTYLLFDEASRDAVLIDPVLEQVERDAQLISELGLTLRYVLDTHVHADHVTGAGALREKMGGLTVSSTKGAPCADVHVKAGDVLRAGSISLLALSTPGHTDDSLSFLVGDHVFTGDALLIRGCGRTDFQNGNASQLYRSLTETLFSLPDETLVCPAHDYKGLSVSTIGEEKRFNPRVAGKSEAEFVAIMDSLHLPAPRRLNEAVPANRACGMIPEVPQG